MVCAITSLAYSKQSCVVHIVCYYSSKTFYIFFGDLVTMSSDVTDVWQYNYDVTLTLTLVPHTNKRKKEKGIK